MIEVFSHGNTPSYLNMKYVLDSPEDIEQLPTSALQGSIAYVISTGEHYMLNGAKQWVKIKQRKECLF